MTREVPPCGPVNASIMIVGEAPGADEESKGIPFVGASGQELDRMLGEAGISRSECFITNVCRTRPPNNDISKYFARSKKDITHDHTQRHSKHFLHPIRTGLAALEKEISMVKPNIIIALGNISFWAITGRWGITKWRGSMLHGVDSMSAFQCIPYDPSRGGTPRMGMAIVSVVTDLRRRCAIPYLQVPHLRLELRHPTQVLRCVQDSYGPSTTRGSRR